MFKLFIHIAFVLYTLSRRARPLEGHVLRYARMSIIFDKIVNMLDSDTTDKYHKVNINISV